MTVSYDWHFGPLDVEDAAPFEGVARIIHWQCEAVRGEDSDRIVGTFKLPEPGEDFTPLSEADQSVRRAWIEAADPDFFAEKESWLQASLDEKAVAAAVNKRRVD